MYLNLYSHNVYNILHICFVQYRLSGISVVYKDIN